MIEAPHASVAQNEPNTVEAPPRRFYVPQLDGLRFFAFLLVFVHHGPKLHGLFPPNSIARSWDLFLEGFGWVGVDLFLVLSAFLITSLLLLEYDRYGSISLRGFYMRRILRIWPLYYLMCAIGFFLFPWLGLFAFSIHTPEHAVLMKNHFVPFITLFGNFSSGWSSYATVGTLAHLWTVTLEEQFYVFWPLTLSVMIRVRRWALWLLLASMLVLAVTLRLTLTGIRPHPFIWTNTLARLDPLVIGIAVALWRHAHPARPGWKIPLLKIVLGWLAVASISLAPGIESQSRNIAWQFLATAVGFGLILDAILGQGKNPFSWLLSRRLFVWLGKLTYGLYVYHIIGIQVGGEVMAFLSNRRIVTSPSYFPIVNLVVSLLITIGIAAESYRLFESFFLRLKDRFSRVQSRPVDVKVG